MTSTTKSIQLYVPKEYQLDSWFKDAKPDETALVLDLASRLPRIVGDEKNDMAAKLYAARQDGTNETIKKVLEEACYKADAKVKNELETLRNQLENTKTQRDQLIETQSKNETSLLIAEESIKTIEKNHLTDIKNIELALREEHNKIIQKYEHDLLQKDHQLQLENSRIKAYEKHIEDTSELKIDAIKREISLESAKQYQQLKEELLETKAQHDQLEQNLSQQILSARQEEKTQAYLREQKLAEQYNASYELLRTSKLETDSKLLQTQTENCQVSKELTTLSMKHSQEIVVLKDKITELQNPMGRGNAGEFDVAQTLKDIGYHVDDTSDGEKKEAGYLDLLVRCDNTTVENMRIAIEVKNKKTIKKASDEKVKRKDKDIDDDIRTFQQRAKDGIKNGLFDAAMFVSIRAHTKMGAPVVLEMFEDTTNRPLAPVCYIGPEKGKVVLPLTQEQLETQMYMMFCVLDQSHNIRRDLCNGLKDEEITSFQSLFEDMGSYLNKTFTDLRKQEHLIHDMNTNLTDIRMKCIHMFRSIYSINKAIPWLQRNINGDWVESFETAKDRALTMNDADVWNKMSKQKATIENTIGKDAMLRAIRAENTKEEQQHTKKQRVSE